MGGKNSAPIGTRTTAKEVIEESGEGQYLIGKTFIVTGGNSGIGTETVKALASAGARVILCSRSVSAGTKAVENEVKRPGEGGYVVANPNISVMQLDLNSLKSVKSFATEFLAHEDRLDGLILNAGIMATPKLERTEDGFEKQIGVNFFGHVYLIRLLLDRMKETKGNKSRIVFLSSIAHDMGKLIPSDLNYSKGRKYEAWDAYGQSKLACMLYARKLAETLKDTHITAVSVHPGKINTGLWKASIGVKIVGALINDKNVPQGAATSVYAAVSPNVATPGMRGVYLSDCGASPPRTEAARDVDGVLCKQLWEAAHADLDAALAAAGL